MLSAHLYSLVIPVARPEREFVMYRLLALATRRRGGLGGGRACAHVLTCSAATLTCSRSSAPASVFLFRSYFHSVYRSST